MGQDKAYRVFPYTFLQSVIVKVDFDGDTTSCRDAWSKSLKTTFGLDITEDRLLDLRDKPLYFGNSAKSIRWILTDRFILLKIEQEAYQDFSNSLYPYIETIESFFNGLKVELKIIELEKINLIPSNAVHADEMIRNAKSVFSEALLKNWGKDNLFQSSEECSIYRLQFDYNNTNSTEIISGIIIEKNREGNNQPSRYVLDLTAKQDFADGIEKKTLPEIVETLNLQLFSSFMDSIADEIIKSMEGGKHD